MENGNAFRQIKVETKEKQAMRFKWKRAAAINSSLENFST